MQHQKQEWSKIIVDTGECSCLSETLIISERVQNKSCPSSSEQSAHCVKSLGQRRREKGDQLADHCNRVNPDVDGIACTTQVRLVELVAFGPAERSVDETFLYDGMEPCQQEVQTSSLDRSLHTDTQFCH